MLLQTVPATSGGNMVHNKELRTQCLDSSQEIE